MQQSIIFAQANGYFPSADQLNINSDSDLLQVVPYYLGNNNNAIGDTSIPTACGQYGSVEVTLDAQALGFSSSVANNNGAPGVYM